MLYQLSYAGSVRNTSSVFRQNANTNNTTTKTQATTKAVNPPTFYALFASSSYRLGVSFKRGDDYLLRPRRGAGQMNITFRRKTPMMFALGHSARDFSTGPREALALPGQRLLQINLK